MDTLWVNWAISQINRDFQRSADTHLLHLNFPKFDKAGIHLYLKDESTHPTGSLKHRLARSLFLYGLSNGWIKKDTPIIECSSGSTAISEAYFAKLLGLEFIAVIPKTTAQNKIKKIEFYGGRCHLVEKCSDIYNEAEKLAEKLGGHYMDQFTFAERATDWRGNNNIAESIFEQMSFEEYSCPEYIVVGAGTGGTSATIGRYINYFPKCPKKKTKLVVADPVNSVFYQYFQTGDKTLSLTTGSGIEGIGRPRVEPSFIKEVIDEMIQVTNEQSIGTAHFLEPILGKKVGASTGTNVYACLEIMERMLAAGKQGSIVSLLCDSGHLYEDSYYSDDWLSAHSIDVEKVKKELTSRI